MVIIMYNVKFPLFFCLLFEYLGKSVVSLLETVSVNKESRPRLLVFVASPRHSGTPLAWMHSHTHTHAQTQSLTHISNEEIIMTTKQILCCPFFVFYEI